MPDIDDTELHSSRLLLRPYQDADAALFRALIHQNAARLAPAFPSRVRATEKPEEALRLLKQFRVDWQLGQMYVLGIWLKPQGIYIGDISLKNFDNTVPKAEVAYYLAAEAEGKGYAREALQLLLHFAFNRLKVNKLYLRCSLQNRHSAALAEKCGFQKEGLLRADFRDDQKNLVDVFYYGLTRPDYEQIF